MQFSTTINQWSKNEMGGSLVLPDGWYGRPYDNQHVVTSVDEAGDRLTVILDHKITLYFLGLKSIQICDRELVFGPFIRMRFEWSAYGESGEHGTKEYDGGEVKLVPAPE